MSAPALAATSLPLPLVRRGKVRRAKLYYLRDRRGKSARIAEVTNYKPKDDAK